MVLRLNPAVILILLFLLAATAVKSQVKPALTDYVNTFIGTAPLNDPKILGYKLPSGWRSWAGLTFPGSSLPNAMVQLSPITAYGSGAGYQYEDSIIYGFAHTNKGHWNLCNIPILPISNPSFKSRIAPGAGSGYSNRSAPGSAPGSGPGSAPGSGPAEKFGSKFSHLREKAEPGFYQVYLDDYKVNVSLTSTLRCGYHRYEFKDKLDRQILFDLSKANSRVSGWKIEQVGPSALEGFQGGENIYFYVLLNTKIETLVKQDVGKPSGYAIVHLANDGNIPVELKIGLSFVSIANARENLLSEIGDKSFNTVRREASQTWNKLLSTVSVKGGTEGEKRMLYSCLYRSFLWPSLRSDVNGEYNDVKNKTVKADFNYYTIPSLWDTYRNKDVLLGLVTPKVTLDVIKSMNDIGDKTGFIPTFFHGDHAASSIAGAYLRGINDFDIKGTYKLLLRNANIAGGTRPYIDEYIQKGYISETDIANPVVETKAKAGVSKTLEYAYDDYSVAQIAKKLGDTANYRILMARSNNYKNVFDSVSGFMRGRLSSGDFIKKFNPEQPYYEYMYREANAWQVSFYAVHDIPGLIKLYGGPLRFEKKLDSFFTVPWNPNYIARNIETMVGQYCQGNQPDHEAPFEYYFVGKPEKSQKIIDYILTNLYGIGDKKLELSGMDDAGEMSSWYVFSALGLYPFSATDPRYLVTVPLFDKVSFKTSTGKILTIVKQGKSRVLTSILVNGKTIKGYFIPHDLFINGGEVTVITK